MLKQDDLNGKISHRFFLARARMAMQVRREKSQALGTNSCQAEEICQQQKRKLVDVTGDNYV